MKENFHHDKHTKEALEMSEFTNPKNIKTVNLNRLEINVRKLDPGKQWERQQPILP